MGLEIFSIQGLSQVAWPGTTGPDSAKQKSAAEGLRSSDPAGAKTPEEALTYIEQLYKTGRTDELVGLLRQSPVFREAWQNLQQFSSTGSEAGGQSASTVPTAVRTPDQSSLPALIPNAASKGQFLDQDQDSAVPQVTGSRGFSPVTLAAQNYPVPAPKPSYTQGVALQAYETQARNYSQAGANSPRISVRV